MFMLRAPRVEPVRLVAHRGFAGVAPENTVAAVRDAAPVADAVEVDVRRCATGELVVCHDATVDRTTDGSGAVGDLPLSDLQSLSVEGSGEPVPTLGAVLAAVPPGVEVFVELKERGLVGDVLAAIAAADVDAMVQSFDATVVDRLRAAPPGVARALLFAEAPERNLARARELDCDVVGVHQALATPAFVRVAHDAGLRVHAWTVTEEGSAATLAAAGVDAVVSDDPDVRPP